MCPNSKVFLCMQITFGSQSVIYIHPECILYIIHIFFVLLCLPHSKRIPTSASTVDPAPWSLLITKTNQPSPLVTWWSQESYRSLLHLTKNEVKSQIERIFGARMDGYGAGFFLANLGALTTKIFFGRLEKNQRGPLGALTKYPQILKWAPILFLSFFYNAKCKHRNVSNS